MKHHSRLLAVSLVVGVLLVLHSTAFAAQEQRLLGDRFSLSIGYKIWVAKWKSASLIGRNALVAGGSGAGGVTTGANGSFVEELNSHTTVLQGPTITGVFKLRQSPWFHSVFANFTWVQGGFDFKTNLSTDLGALRRDYSITGGVAVWKGLAVFAGFYHQLERFDGGSSTSISGPIFGVSGSGQVSEQVGLYGNTAFAILDQKFSNGGSVGANQGWASEVGVNIGGPGIGGIGTAIQIGFRTQFITATLGESPVGESPTTVGLPTNVQATDITWGPIFTVLAKF